MENISENKKENLEAEKKTLSKRSAREQAFLLTFERTFSTNENIDDIIEAAEFARKLEVDDFAKKLFCGVDENIAKIDDIIQRNIKGWSFKRISRVSVTIIRIAVYEIAIAKITAVSIAINEAVLLAKKYGADKEYSFVNGVLGGISRNEDVIREKK